MTYKMGIEDEIRLIKDMEAKRESLRKADEQIIAALSWATKGLEKGVEWLGKEISGPESMAVMDTMAGLCKEMSKLRSSMNDAPNIMGYGV